MSGRSHEVGDVVRIGGPLYRIHEMPHETRGWPDRWHLVPAGPSAPSLVRTAVSASRTVRTSTIPTLVVTRELLGAWSRLLASRAVVDWRRDRALDRAATYLRAAVERDGDDPDILARVRGEFERLHSLEV